MNLIVSEKELQQCGVDKEMLLSRFKEQLMKDFEMSNVALNAEALDDLEYFKVHQLIRGAIHKLSQTERMSLLYRIDVTELKLSGYLNENKEKSMDEAITDLIIKRILQKVILKIIYSNRK